MSREQWLALASGAIVAFLFKVLSLFAEASMDSILTDWRNWVASAIFAGLGAAAAYVLARLDPSGPRPPRRAVRPNPDA